MTDERQEIKTETSSPVPGTSFDEAPASVNTRLKSPKGFVYQWTMRDEKNSSLVHKVLAMETKWLEMGFTPVENYDKFGSKPRQIAPLEYVSNRTCPQCDSRLIYARKKDGTKFIKCETNKYINGQATGCSFVEWSNPKPRQTQGDYDINQDY